MPAPLAYLWNAYWRLRRRRGGNGFGHAPITWSDIDGFTRFTGVSLAPWEVEVIEDLDDMFLTAMAGAGKEEE